MPHLFPRLIPGSVRIPGPRFTEPDDARDPNSQSASMDHEQPIRRASPEEFGGVLSGNPDTASSLALNAKADGDLSPSIFTGLGCPSRLLLLLFLRALRFLGLLLPALLSFVLLAHLVAHGVTPFWRISLHFAASATSGQ